MSRSGRRTLKLSIVLITRNQDWNVTRLVASARRVAAGHPATEIVLVDSASTDRTVELARETGIAVLQLAPDQRLTAAAGRYVGFMHTTGEYVLFVDGDMELAGPWLDRAVDLLDRDPTIGAVGGKRFDLPVDTIGSGLDLVQITPATTEPQEVRHVNGTGVYRRAALDEVGCFNPFIISDEEPELNLRLRYRTDYRLVRIDMILGFHFSDPIEEFSTLISRSRKGLDLGAGQNLRATIGTDLFWPYVRERGFGLPVIAWGAIGLGAGLGSVVTRKRTPSAAWLSLTAAYLGFEVARKRSVRKVAYSLLKRLLIAQGTIRGFFLPPQDADEYPARLVEEP
jgi:glycosyltransferase involved in cell wall biosynthesis